MDLACTVWYLYHCATRTFYTPSRCVGSNLNNYVTRASKSSHCNLLFNFKHDQGQAGKASQAAPQGNKQHGGSLLGKKHQEEGRLQSFHMHMHAHVPVRTHKHTHTHAHKYITHARTHVHNARTHVRARTHTYAHAHKQTRT